MKVLVASHAIPGHALFLTGPVRRLVERGHEVQWYTGESLRGVVEALGARLRPFDRAVEHRADNLDELYPARTRLKGPMQSRHDGEKVFAAPVADMMADIADIRADFAFSVALLDMSTYVAVALKRTYGVPVVAAAAISSMERDPWVPPLWLGLQPDRSPKGRLRDAFLHLVSDKVIMGPANRTYTRRMHELGFPGRHDLTQDPYREADLVVQQGLAASEFPRRHPNPRVLHPGPMLPWQAPTDHPVEDSVVARRADFERCVVVTQGTVDVDPEKLIVPTIEACRAGGVRTLVVASGLDATEDLRRRFGGDDLVVEPRLDFTRLLDVADVFVTNGGAGGVVLALTHGVPIVGAGFSEGKNDVLAHVEYHRVGVNLRTETPTPAQLAAAIDTCATDTALRARGAAFRDASAGLDPAGVVADRVEALVAERVSAASPPPPAAPPAPGPTSSGRP